MARDFNLQGYEDGFFVGRTCLTTSPPTWTSTSTRSSARSCHSCARETYEEALGWRWITNTATAPRSSPATAMRRAISPTAINVGMVGINVPIPVPLAYHTFGGWKKSVFGDLEPARPGCVQILHTHQDRDRALAVRHQRRRRILHSNYGISADRPHGLTSEAPGASRSGGFFCGRGC